MKSFNEIINQPTNSDGSYKGTVWTTAVKQSLDNGTLSITDTDIGVAYTVSGKTFEVSKQVLAIANLEKVYSGKANLTPEKLFTIQSKDFVILLQQTTSLAAGSKKVTKPAEGHVLTAQEWLDSHIAQTSLDDIRTKFASFDNQKATSEERKKFIDDVDRMLTPQLSVEHQAKYNELLLAEKREKLIAEQKSISDARIAAEEAERDARIAAILAQEV